MKLLRPESQFDWIAQAWQSSLPDYVLAGVNDDDCAIVQLGDQVVVITTDFLNANPIAIQQGIGTYHDLGVLLVGSNLSDLASTGAKPVGFLVGATLPRSSSEGDFREFMEGTEAALKSYGVPLLGGDTKLGSHRALIGTAIGVQEAGAKLFPMKNAKVGDDVWASGFLGSMSAALIAFQKNSRGGREDWIRQTILSPRVPMEKSISAARQRLGNAGTDVSDGLGMDLLALCRKSKVGVKIEADLLPIDPVAHAIASLADVESWKLPFLMGGDFQFVLTAPTESRTGLQNLGFHRIGTCTDQSHLVVTPDGTPLTIPEFGHSDANGVSFVDEVLQHLRKL